MKSDSKSILLVDDDEKLMRSLARTFDENQFVVHQAVSAAEAMVILNHNSIDVLICDNQMVGINGTRLLSFVRKNYPNTLRFMLTGDISRSQTVVVENEIGVCEVFEKPYSAEALLESVRHAMSVAN